MVEKNKRIFKKNRIYKNVIKINVFGINFF